MYDAHLVIWRALGDPDFGPLASIPLGPRIATCQWSDSFPGGFNGLTVALSTSTMLRRCPWLREDPRAGDFYHVQLVAAGLDSAAVSHWEGRIEETDFKGSGLGTIIATGYGVGAPRDTVFQSGSSQSVNGRTLLEYALSFCPTIQWRMGDLSGFQDPGVYHTLSDLNYQTVEQVVQRLSKLGGIGDNLFDFAVWENRRVDFTARTCPVDAAGRYLPDYRVDMDASNVDVRRSVTESYGSVIARYTPPNASGTFYTTPQTDPTFPSRFGFMRGPKLIDVGTVTLVDAQQLARTWLNWHRFALVKAKLTYKPGETMQTASGGDADPRYARTGDWVQIGEDTVYIPPQRVIRSQKDIVGNVTLELGNPYPGDDTTIAHLRSVADHVVAGTSPVSSAAV